MHPISGRCILFSRPTSFHSRHYLHQRAIFIQKLGIPPALSNINSEAASDVWESKRTPLGRRDPLLGYSSFLNKRGIPGGYDSIRIGECGIRRASIRCQSLLPKADGYLAIDSSHPFPIGRGPTEPGGRAQLLAGERPLSKSTSRLYMIISYSSPENGPPS
jgi:hypothetical protein